MLRAASVTSLGSALFSASFDGITPEDPLRNATLPRTVVRSPLQERDALKGTIADLATFREEMVARYTHIERGKEQFLLELKGHSKRDRRELDQFMQEGSEVVAKLALRLDFLERRRKQLNEQENDLNARFEKLEQAFTDAKTEHTRIQNRLTEEKTKIEELEASISRLERDLQAAIADRDQAKKEYDSIF